jgi:exonuclease SbcC
MILRSLELKNIRSYNDQTVTFPLGTTLFEGDIGSGKSTILMAIEFALFGLGSERGGALLKAGAKKGSVKLKFDIEGKEYEICRNLERKAKSVQQADCSFGTEEGVLNLSASEIKEKVLEVLNFNEPPDPKAQSVIYRYAIFTPQEEMKAILWMRPDFRLQTLRKAFRIEDYRIAIDNSSILTKSIKEKSIRLASHAFDLEDDLASCKSKRAKIDQCSGQLTTLTKREEELKAKSRNLREQIDTLQKKKDALGKAVGEIPLLESQIEEKKENINDFQDEANALSKEIEEKLKPNAEKLRKTEKPTNKTTQELKEELEKLKTNEKNLRKIETTIDTKIKDYESVEKNGTCPTCDRPASPKEFEGKIKQKIEEKRRASEEVSDCETKINETEKLQESLQEYEKAQVNLQNLDEKMEKNNERIEKDLERIKVLTEQVEEAIGKLQQAQHEVEEFNKVTAEAKILDSKVEEIQSEIDEVVREISTIQTTISLLEKEVDELKTRIETKEKERRLVDRLKEYNIWLEDFLIPTLDMIEKHVMLSINQEFNQNYQKWWSMLVEDPSKDSRIDEDFTPIIEQDGYEQDFNYLSGGEKTSLALAYRLALNTIVQKVSIGIRSNLLILDEPTDGFSKEQLFKIREILAEIQCPQVIMVSHERELESFADHVLKVEKREGVSEIISR